MREVLAGLPLVHLVSNEQAKRGLGPDERVAFIVDRFARGTWLGTFDRRRIRGSIKSDMNCLPFTEAIPRQ